MALIFALFSLGGCGGSGGSLSGNSNDNGNGGTSQNTFSVIGEAIESSDMAAVMGTSDFNITRKKSPTSLSGR